MPRPCTICHHPEREEIEKALLENEAGHRLVAKRFDISPQALFRHRQKHLPALIARALAAMPPPPRPPEPEDPADFEYATKIAHHKQALEAGKDRHAIDAMQQLKAINAACLEVLRKAREAENHSILLRAVDRIARQIELQARLLGEIQDGQTVNVAILPEWHGIRHAILEALRPFPEARLAVARALQGGAL
ncbi:MAG: hypothetical protein HC897_04285 [Thermoanaerobaculia bacterium]|nr:hypothetical protein [Thermoanaerobaculia bacterium]